MGCRSTDSLHDVVDGDVEQPPVQRPHLHRAAHQRLRDTAEPRSCIFQPQRDKKIPFEIKNDKNTPTKWPLQPPSSQQLL